MAKFNCHLLNFYVLDKRVSYVAKGGFLKLNIFVWIYIVGIGWFLLLHELTKIYEQVDENCIAFDRLEAEKYWWIHWSSFFINFISNLIPYLLFQFPSPRWWLPSTQRHRVHILEQERRGTYIYSRRQHRWSTEFNFHSLFEVDKLIVAMDSISSCRELKPYPSKTITNYNAM